MSGLSLWDDTFDGNTCEEIFPTLFDFAEILNSYSLYLSIYCICTHYFIRKKKKLKWIDCIPNSSGKVVNRSDDSSITGGNLLNMIIPKSESCQNEIHFKRWILIFTCNFLLNFFKPHIPSDCTDLSTF